MILATFPLQTIYDLYPDIMDDLALPDGVDRDMVIGELLAQLGELDVIYQDPDRLQAAIRTWSYSMKYKWDKMYQTTVVEYDPLINRDYNREETATGSSTVDRKSVV